MKNKSALLIVACFTLALLYAAYQLRAHLPQRSVVASAAAAEPELTLKEVPPLPENVAELKFNDFFDFPISEGGLSYSETIRALDGRKVRILGYMVKQETPSPGLFLLTPTPQQLHEEEYGLCDDLPPATLHVVMAREPDVVAPFTPGLMLLTGTLRVGTREEADGRISAVRLELARPGMAAPATAEADVSRAKNFAKPPGNPGLSTANNPSKNQKG